MAIRVEQITTLEQISKIIWDQQYQSTLMRNRSPYLYRGLPNSNYHLGPVYEEIAKKRRMILNWLYCVILLNTLL